MKKKNNDDDDDTVVGNTQTLARHPCCAAPASDTAGALKA